jgi:hypothetical protein
VANTIMSRFRTAWNVFMDKDPIDDFHRDGGQVSSRPMHRHTMTMGTEKSIVNAVYTRCAIDVAALNYRHIKLDQNGSFIDNIDSGLNKCLSISANIDQSHMAFMLDVVISMFDEGHVAIVPVDTSVNMSSGSYDILSLRTGKVLEWHPSYVRVRLYNDRSGRDEDILIDKNKVAIIENPFYSTMNAPNSTLQRLINKLNLLDVIDEQSGSGKLDIIIQLPYAVKSPARQLQAEQRRAALQAQLKDSQYGVAYADAVEKIVQLNRPAENNLLAQVEYLTTMVYNQLGMTQKILDGTAMEEEFLNYYNRTILPVADAIVFEMKRKFLTQTAITQGQSIGHFRDVFSMVTAKNLAELADKFTRNEIASSNEMRAVVGWKPSSDPRANELVNKNIAEPPPAAEPVEVPQEEVPAQY